MYLNPQPLHTPSSHSYPHSRGAWYKTFSYSAFEKGGVENIPWPHSIPLPRVSPVWTHHQGNHH